LKVDSKPPLQIDEYFQAEILTPHEWRNALDTLDELGYKVRSVDLRRRYDPHFKLGEGIFIKLFPDEDQEDGDALGDADVVLHLEGEYRVVEEV
jgi:hypothetical protein